MGILMHMRMAMVTATVTLPRRSRTTEDRRLILPRLAAHRVAQTHTTTRSSRRRPSEGGLTGILTPLQLLQAQVLGTIIMTLAMAPQMTQKPLSMAATPTEAASGLV